MKQLTPMDSHFFYFEAPNQPMMIGSLWLCDQSTAPGGLVRHKDILQYVSDRLNTTSYFRRRLEKAPFQLDDPYWLDDENFDLEYHVRHVGLPQPGDWRQLCIFTARTMSRSVDMERAPWEIYIIEGVNNVEGVPPNSFAVLIRFHHAYVDGKASLELTTAMMEETADHEYGRRDRVEVAERAPTRLEMWSRTTPRMMGQAWRSMRAGLTAGRKSIELARRLRSEAKPEQRRVPRTIFNVQISPHRSYGALTWNIPELKRMRQLCPGATLNDVVISIIAGGMRRYLSHHNQLPASESLVAMCPVSVRPTEAMKDCGNLISAMFIGIGTDIGEPLERLSAVRRSTARGVPLARDVLCDLNNAVGDMMPPYVRALGAWLQNKSRLASTVPLVNTLITNVPGIPGLVPRYFAGARIVNVFPLAPVSDGMGISHCLTGIYDDLNVGVLADRNIVSDMDFYMSCIQASTEEYRALLAELEKTTAASMPARVEAPKPATNEQEDAEPDAEKKNPSWLRQAGRSLLPGRPSRRSPKRRAPSRQARPDAAR
jgi:WS/DGAT/MGAT family acyltransferase